MGGVGFGGKLCSADEEAVLYADEAGSVCRLTDIGEEQADLGIEFVDGAIALETCAGLFHSLSADKRRHAGIAGTGIDFVHLLSDCL